MALRAIAMSAVGNAPLLGCPAPGSLRACQRKDSRPTLRLFFSTTQSNQPHIMGKIQFGSEVYTWFMQGTGKGYDNKLDHMIKVAAQAGFKGIEPMVLEISEKALGCSKYWLGDFCDPKR